MALYLKDKHHISNELDAAVYTEEKGFTEI